MVQPFFGFWEKLSKPIIGLAPMDGVTDFAFRYIVARHGRPDVIFTEFTTAEGMFYVPERVLKDFEYHEMERPVVAQLFGSKPEEFYKATHVVCELGFDGVDINMGCPSKQIVKQAAGAALIRDQPRALAILQSVRAAIHDWSQGQTLEKIKLSQVLIDIVEQMNLARTGKKRPAERRLLPYSLKTRIGYEEVVIESWIETLLTEAPAAISIHGRTLQQMYKGEANWEMIRRAATVAKGSGTLILGNGDIASIEDAKRWVAESGVDGALIGRQAIGNPWVFKNKTADQTLRLQTALEHARYFVSHRPTENFKCLNKHLIQYLRHFPEAAQIRMAAVAARDVEELNALLFPAREQTVSAGNHKEG